MTLIRDYFLWALSIVFLSAIAEFVLNPEWFTVTIQNPVLDVGLVMAALVTAFALGKLHA